MVGGWWLDGAKLVYVASYHEPQATGEADAIAPALN